LWDWTYLSNHRLYQATILQGGTRYMKIVFTQIKGQS
jgi:hypothetical protein